MPQERSNSLEIIGQHRHNNKPLRFVGTGPERARVEGAGYEVSGWLDHRQLARRYRRAALLLLLPRWQEPFGIVGLEALACGVPVAAWQSGGIAEWHPATLPEWGDLDGAAELARSLCGARAGAPRGCHDPAVLTDQLEGLYRELRGAR